MASGLCRVHDPDQAVQAYADRAKGGQRSRTRRLSKGMKRLVDMLFSNPSDTPTLADIEPEPFPEGSCQPHIVFLDGMRARSIWCRYNCEDQSLLAQALRLMRIQTMPDGTYVHGSRTVPNNEIAKVRKLVRRG